MCSTLQGGIGESRRGRSSGRVNQTKYMKMIKFNRNQCKLKKYNGKSDTALQSHQDYYIAHCCAIFLCHPGCEIQHTVVTPYMGVQIVNKAAQAKNDQFGFVFLQNVRVRMDFLHLFSHFGGSRLAIFQGYGQFVGFEVLLIHFA